jgi:hypothetical protein
MRKLIVFLLFLIPILGFSDAELLKDRGHFGTSLGIGTQAPDGSLDVVGTQAFLPGPSSAPADGLFAPSQWTLWLDEASDEFELKAKKSGGGIITQTIGSGSSGAAAVRFDLNGPFNTTFERIDGIHVCDATVTYTAARSFVYYNGTAGNLTAQIWLNNASTGASGDITIPFSVTPSVDNETISVTCNAGDYIWVDITGLPTGTVEDFSVVLYE